ncbi:peptidylprolyl isomerase [Roseospira navarrensis]|uniref:Parvulin-like PPIase n=1 Tax=Roseospira navarrensis TaxID=140058 RepID=A0A7X1ZD46_9PROT|nr:peptidylprolyl isomerase [Roseospira navarrensis]MQX35192.1 peptidylprolyl isomerase [Roseospira navarrensis]
MKDIATRRRPARARSLRLLPAAAVAVAVAIGSMPSAAPKAQPAADMVLRIAAVVNDDIISVYDLDARTDILIRSAGMPDTAEMRERLRSQVLRALIDETLKLQEGERLGLSVSDEEMESAVAQLEQQNRIPPGGFEDFIRAAGVDRNSALRQVRAEVMWIKAVRTLFAQRVDISEEQVDLVMDRLNAARGKPEHLVSEIYLPVDNPSEEARVRENAQRLVAQLREGAALPPLARQFSQSPSAAKGGQLGWVRQGDLNETLENALLAMQPETYSEPIRTVAGYHILALADRRRTAEPEPEKARLTVSQLALPSRGPKALSRATREEVKTVVANSVKTCEDMNRLAQEMDVPNSGPVGTVSMARVEGPIRDVLMNLGENQVSEPLPTPGGELILMVCDREVPGGMPTRDEIQTRLRNERLETLANRHLRTLRQQALIDVRI